MQTPLGVLAKGAIAGVAGTAAMDLFQYLQYRAGGGKDGPVTWEFSSVPGWDGAPAPAQIGKRVFEALFARKLPDRAANRVNNVMHWGYGISWAAAFGIVTGSASRSRARLGPVFGTVVFLADYVVLPPTASTSQSGPTTPRPSARTGRATLSTAPRPGLPCGACSVRSPREPLRSGAEDEFD